MFVIFGNVFQLYHSVIIISQNLQPDVFHKIVAKKAISKKIQTVKMVMDDANTNVDDFVKIP